MKDRKNIDGQLNTKIVTAIIILGLIIIVSLVSCADNNPSFLEASFFGVNNIDFYSPCEPTNPFPVNHATDQNVNVQLSWECFNSYDDSIIFDIYFDTLSNPSIAGYDIMETAYNPGTLRDMTTYYWKIVTRIASGDSTIGEIWQFTTEMLPDTPPDQPSNPFPAENTQSPSLNIQLRWECNDSDGDSLEYDVYFGLNPSPPLVSSKQSGNNYSTGILSDNSTYHWYIVAFDDDSNSTMGPQWIFNVIYEGKIVYSAYPQGNYTDHISVIDVDGTNQEVILNSGGDAYDPAWSPDGLKIAYCHLATLYMMNSDGSNHIRLNDLWMTDNSPCWSPDGSQIAYTSRGNNDDIWVIDTSGANQQNITNLGTNEWDPSWSPNGMRIAFVTDRNGYSEIYTMNYNGSDQIRLTSNNDYDAWPDYSPNGEQIVFASDRDGNYEIYKMNSDGTTQTRLTINSAADSQPCWSPDGAKIAFISDRDSTYEIFVMNADGSNQTNISNTSDYNELSPDWGFPPY